MNLNFPRFAGINDARDAARAFSDLQIFLDQLQLILTPPSSGVSIIALDSSGDLSQYTLVQGAGVTITRDDTTKTWTVSSP